MKVQKRNGNYEPVMFEKITARIKKLCYELDTTVDACMIAQKVIQGVYDGVTVSEIDDLAAETAAFMTTHHPDFAKLAARISVSNLHKNTDKTFSKVIETLRNNKHHGKPAPLIAEDIYDIVMCNSEQLNAAVVFDRDFNFDYFGFKTLERSYLMRVNNIIQERPQHMIMRVAVGIHKDDVLFLKDGQPIKKFGSQGQQKNVPSSPKISTV